MGTSETAQTEKSEKGKQATQAAFSWLAEETGRSDPASQAWSLLHWLMISSKPRFMAINQEFDLAPQQAIALRILGGGPRAMGELAKYLMCDSSNVTGITDRLEERGLVRREPGEKDRRVKMLVLTDEGDRVRAEVTKRLAEPPPWLAELPEADQRKLKEILESAIETSEVPGP
jgi:MarR family transcriptional regulator, organic hydroperoxide resistance regulator